MRLDEKERKKLIARLRRAEGQTAALRRMVEEDSYCVDVLLQISAVQGALAKVGEILLRSHVQTCVAEAFMHGDEAERRQKVDEMMDVFARFGRTGAGRHLR